MVALAFAEAGASSAVRSNGAWCHPGGAQAACFATLLAPAGDRLLEVTSPSATRVEIVEVGPDGVRPLTTGLPLPAGQAVKLSTRGKRLILTGLKRSLSVGDRTTLTLRFQNAPPQTLTAFIVPVLPQTPQGGPPR